MPAEVVTASLKAARRLAVTKQRLAGRLPDAPSRSGILSVVRDLGYVQWDPVSIVAPSHLLSLWSRLGDLRPSDLDRLLWAEKKLLLHWTPMASLVLMEDYPLYASLMSRYPESLTTSWGAQRTEAKRFLSSHSKLRSRVLSTLRHGPRRVRELVDHARTPRDEGEWAPSSDVAEMLFHLLMRGEVVVVGHQGSENLWGLAEEFLPDSVCRAPLSETEAEREAACRAIRALGTATSREITHYFVRGRYAALKATLAALLEEDELRRVQVEGATVREERYVVRSDVRRLESMETDVWQPRMSLLPPFDNLVCTPARTQRIFGFEYVREQFLPKEKRRYGTYVLPILWGDRFVGRIDPHLDRASGVLEIHSVHSEPGAEHDREIGERLAATVDRLAEFLGATRVKYGPAVPRAWKGSLG